MGFYNKYPYTDFHELNLDWILAKLREMDIRIDEFEAVNTITFSGAWDITQQYQAWTVVSDNNIGYISIQPVPAGIAINNTNYWRIIVDYSAQIAGMQTDILNMQNDISVIEAKIDPGKWLFIGDSYQAYGHWYETICNNLSLTNNVNAFYCGASGHGFTSSTSWEDDYNVFISGRTDLSEFKNVVVVGGLNDSTASALASNAAPLKAAILSFCATVESAMPNALISVGYVGSALSDSPDLQGRTAQNRQYTTQVYKQEFTRYGHRYLRNCEYAMYKPQYFLSDGIHPTSGAAGEIASCVAEALLTGGSCTVLSDYRRTDNVAFQTGECHCMNGADNNVTSERALTRLRMVRIPSVTNAFVIGGTSVDLGEIPSFCYIRNTGPQRVIAQKSNAGAASWMVCQVWLQDAHLRIMSDTWKAGPALSQMSVDVGDQFDLGTLTFEELTILTQ